MSYIAYILISLITYVLLKAFRSYQAHKFFKEKSPNLPILEGQRFLIGHLHKWHNPRNWKILHEAHAKFGKYVGFYHANYPWLSTTDLNLVKKFIIDEPNDHINRGKQVSPMDIDRGSMIYAEDDQWRRLRKSFGPALAKHKVLSANVQEEMNEIVDEFIHSLEWRLDKAKEENGDNSVTLNSDDHFHRFSIALSFSCLFKQKNLIDFYADTDTWQKNVIDCFTEQNIYPTMIICNTFPILAPLTQIFCMFFHPHGTLVKRLKGFIRQQTKLYTTAKDQMTSARKNFKSKHGETFNRDLFDLKDGSRYRRNLIDYVIEQYMAGAISDLEYENSAYFLFLAANLTAADALSKLIYNLAANQEIQDKLRESISIEGGINSTYLSWTINESMRLFPPATIGCSRTVTRDIETENGIVIPKGTFVITSAFTIHRLKEYWGDDADQFRPDRWANAKQFHPLQNIIFGAGIRACPGKDFAMREMQLLMNELLRRFKFELADKDHDIMQFQTPNFIVLTPEHPTNIKISRL